MIDLNGLIANYINHSKVDYVGLWQIASHVRDDLGSQDDKRVEESTLAIVRGLVANGLRPGDYLKTGFHYWNEADAEAILARIDREWTALGHDPNLAEPICWFAPAP